MNYKLYLQSKEWKAKKQMVFKHYGRNCVVCGTTKKINVHHMNYDRIGGKEILADLIPVCHKHHMEIHLLQDVEEITVKIASSRILVRYNVQLSSFKKVKKKKRTKKVKKKFSVDSGREDKIRVAMREVKKLRGNLLPDF